MKNIKDILQALKPYIPATMDIKIEALKNKKKNEYWATSIKRYVTNGHDKFNEEGIIYLNLRDIKSDSVLLEAVAHEMSHLLDDKVPKEEILGYLKEKVK